MKLIQEDNRTSIYLAAEVAQVRHWENHPNGFDIVFRQHEDGHTTRLTVMLPPLEGARLLDQLIRTEET